MDLASRTVARERARNRADRKSPKPVPRRPGELFVDAELRFVHVSANREATLPAH